MSNKRPAILMAILLVLIAGYVARPYWMNDGQPKEPLLPGKNAISGLAVSQDTESRWFAEFDYFFVGGPPIYFARVAVFNDAAPGVPASPHEIAGSVRLERGAHHVRLEIQRPYTVAAMSTEWVEADIVGPPADQVRQQIARHIDWPDAQTNAEQQRTRGKSAAELVAMAIPDIDIGNDVALASARKALELAITRDPRSDAAYVELARVAMKTNWSAEGLHQAEGFVSSALQIRPDSANAQVLLGYIEAHQGRYEAAQALYTRLATTSTPNLWLWSNWGEMLAMQGRQADAIAKYREAIAHPHTRDTYDRARVFAYDAVIPLLIERKDLPGAESLFKQRMDEYGASDCGTAAYARFELLQQGDAGKAIDIARRALTARCDDGTLSPRDVLGMAYYVAWSTAPAASQAVALDQARVYLPAGARAFYLLAGDDRSLPAARRLAAAGEPVDQLDNMNMTALAYAVRMADYPTARRLLRLGARTDTVVGCNCAVGSMGLAGSAGIPVAFIPVLLNDPRGIQLMQQSGVDYATLRYQGATAVELARRAGRHDLADLLDPKSKSL